MTSVPGASATDGPSGQLLLLLAAAAALADRFDELASALVSDPSYKVRAQAAIVLGKLKDERGVPALEKALSDDESSIKGAMTFCLGDAAKQVAETVQTYLQGVRPAESL